MLTVMVSHENKTTLPEEFERLYRESVERPSEN
jgi:hypothetical protein